MTLIISILFINIISLFVILCIPNKYPQLIRQIGLGFSIIMFILTVFAIFNNFYNLFSLNFTWMFNSSYTIWFFDFIYLQLNVDSMALAFILLTTYLIPVCLLVSWKSVKHSVKFFVFLILLIEFLMVFAFSSSSIFTFFVAFEALLIPLFFLIGSFGTRRRRSKAAFYLVFYTLFGSMPLVMGVFYIWNLLGSFDYLYIKEIQFSISYEDTLILWLLFFPAFAFKIPLYPFHLWLTEAHVEAPTAGSVILAGLLLKLGGYGFIRFLIGLFYGATWVFSNFVFLLCIISMVFASYSALIQTDMKRIIAYSSITHMALAVMGIFSGTVLGLQGSVFLMLGHGLVSSALFVLIGILYERYGSRYIRYYGGVKTIMPWFSRYFFFFILCNIGFPGTPGFAAELILFISVYLKITLLLFLIFLSLIVSVNVMLLLYNKICNGPVNLGFIPYFVDLDLREHIVLFSLAFFSILMGLFPQFFIDFVSVTGYFFELGAHEHRNSNIYSYLR